MRIGLVGGLTRPLHRLGAAFGGGPGQAACLALSLPFAVVAALAAGPEPRMRAPLVAVAAWLLGIGLALGGGRCRGHGTWRPSGRTLATAAALTLLAFSLRGGGTAHIPRILSGDEGSAGLEAARFLAGERNNLFNVGWYAFPSLYFALQAVSLGLLGQTAEALRLPSAACGALTVGALYLAARPWLGKTPALLAALLLAGSHAHINFSRIGLNNIWDGLGFVVAVGALAHGWRTASRTSFLAAGLAAGLCQYFYVSSRLLPALILGWLLIASFLDRPRLRRALPDLTLMVLVALATGFPLLWHYLRYPTAFVEPIARFQIFGGWMRLQNQLTGAADWQILLHQVWLSLQGFTNLPVRAWYCPGTPLLRPWSAALFVLGLGLLAARWRDGRTWLLVLWLMAFVMAGALSVDTPSAQRYVGALPACALVIAHSLDRVGALLARLRPGAARAITTAVIAAAVLLAADDARFYFWVYSPRSDFGDDNGLVADRLGYYLRGKSSEWEVLFLNSPRMGYRSIPSVLYLAPHIEGRDVPLPWGAPGNPRPRRSRVAFVLLPERRAEVAAVQASYPGGRLARELKPNGNLVYLVYEYAAPGPPVPAPRPAGE